MRTKVTTITLEEIKRIVQDYSDKLGITVEDFKAKYGGETYGLAWEYTEFAHWIAFLELATEKENDHGTS